MPNKIIIIIYLTNVSGTHYMYCIYVICTVQAIARKYIYLSLQITTTKYTIYTS